MESDTRSGAEPVRSVRTNMLANGVEIRGAPPGRNGPLSRCRTPESGVPRAKMRRGCSISILWYGNNVVGSHVW